MSFAPNCVFIAPGVSSASIFPSTMLLTRSQRAASSMLGVLTSMVMPCVRRRSRSSCSRIMASSRPVASRYFMMSAASLNVVASSRCSKACCWVSTLFICKSNICASRWRLPQSNGVQAARGPSSRKGWKLVSKKLNGLGRPIPPCAKASIRG